MFCTSCGSQVPDGTTFCPNCGAQLAAANVPDMAQAPEPVQMPAPTYQPVPQQDFQNPNMPGQIPSPIQTNAANMPNTTTAIILIVVGFICGILWGIIGFTQYKPMKNAIAAGDAETAAKKFNVIKIATIVGIVINVLLIFSRMNGSN